MTPGRVDRRVAPGRAPRTLDRMRRPLAVAAVLALSVVACGGDDRPVEALAVQAERVPGLLEEGEDCRALEATATLQSMADEDSLAEDVRAAAGTWADQARQHLSCDAPAGSDGDDGDGGGADDEDDD